MTRQYRNYTDADVIRVAAEVTSIAGLIKGLGLVPAGGNYASMHRMVQNLGIDTSHWTGKSWNKGKQLKDWSDYTRVEKLKPHLLTLRGHSCECCKLDEWQGSKIPLEVHHVDGDRTNNSVDNLQLLCPNCHALTDSWRRSK